MTEDLIRDLLSASNTEMTRLGNEVGQLRLAQLELVRVAERQASTLDQIKAISERLANHDDRLRKIEVKQPQLLEMRTWILMAVAAVVSVVFTFVSGRIFTPDSIPVFPPRAAIVDTRSTVVVVV